MAYQRVSTNHLNKNFKKEKIIIKLKVIKFNYNPIILNYYVYNIFNFRLIINLIFISSAL